MALARIGFLLFFMLNICHAEIPHWKIDGNNSHIYFTATQNNAPVKGEFKKYSGQIIFAPDELDKSSVNMTLDLNSISTTYATIADTLKTAEWFDVKLFPNAKFESKELEKMPDGSFEVKGTLTIRNVSQPITLHFVLEDFKPLTARAKGQATLKRLDFNIGSGEWTKTDVVRDEVTIDFMLNVERE